MNRRTFLKQAVTALACSPSLCAADNLDTVDLKNCIILAPEEATVRERTALTAFVEEVDKRSGLQWTVETASAHLPAMALYAFTRSSDRVPARIVTAQRGVRELPAEGYVIRTGSDESGRWIAVGGADERGLLFGLGKLLRSIHFGQQSASIPAASLNLKASPRYSLRGHQLGYRPKTNAYDAWDVATWNQYIRDLAMFGTNAIELVPPRSDDLPESPHFPLPPERMMIEMSRIADSYGLDVWIWYPAMEANYADPATVEAALKEWAHTYQILPRLDAVFVPGGDPGHTEPNAMLAFLKKQKASLRRYHPKAQMWVSPQGFRAEWMRDFFQILEEAHTATWLDGVVFGPQTRLSLPEFRQRLPKHYPIRFYPDITHSLECQYPVPDWDVAYALTEGRECINPRPEGEANIFRRCSSYTIGFITYSEGCNDDVNKFVWSSLGWNPDQPVVDVLRDYAQYFMGAGYAEGIAQGMLNLENNWRGPLLTNSSVNITLSRFQDLENAASPRLLENWRFQQLLYRAYYDASVRIRLLEETACVQRALGVLGRIREIGWTPEPLDIGQPPSSGPPNGHSPEMLLEEAERILRNYASDSAAGPLLTRVRELGEALFQSIRMQLAVDRYQGEAVVRGANLETLDYPVSDAPWLLAQIAAIRKRPNAQEQITAIEELLRRTDPGAGGFYDELGNPANRPHLVLGLGAIKDPEFRSSALTGFSYPDRLGSQAPLAWKRWAESLYDAPLRMRYTGLDPEAQYRIRVVYSGDARRLRIRLVANDQYEIHPLLQRPWPPQPLEFDIPHAATTSGQLELAWTREQGLGGNGRGCQVAEVWLMRK